SKMLGMNETGRLSGEEIKRVSVIHQAGEELLRLINDILDLSKIESGRMELHAEEITTDEVLSECRSLFEATAHEKGLQFLLEARWHGVFVTDHAKLSQILRNLLSNAFKFTKQGAVTLRVERDNAFAQPILISVTDSGIGIPEDKQELIFQAFHQVDGTISREFGGTGLGLTISQRFAELLGGSISISSTVGTGSTFTLHLPLQPDTVIASPPATEAVPSAPQPAVPELTTASSQVSDDRNNLISGDTVILLIDDDPAYAGVVVNLNHKLGYKTIIALTGEEGLRLAKIYRPKGILLDLGLPDMDGNQVLHTLKTSPELRKIPVCVVSARDKQSDFSHQGIVGYLQKPVSFEQLADAEAEVIQRAVEYGKIVLVLEGGSLTAGEIGDLLGGKAKVIQAGTLEAAIAVAERGGVAVAILDMEQPGDTLDICRRLHAADLTMPILLHGSKALSEEDAAALSQFTDSIILKKPRAQERMLENIERFLQYQVPSSASTHEIKLPEPSPKNAEKLAGKTILVVDDDPRNLFVITAALEQAGAHVDNVLNGLKAMEYLSRNKPDLIFMDIMMPDMDGYVAIRKIRETPYLKNIPIVALTAKALRSDKEKAMEVGADDFLAKPVDYDVLINAAVVWCGDKA
ncbi:MAG: response regulator, partial [Methylococcaceae bacterium]